MRWLYLVVIVSTGVLSTYVGEGILDRIVVRDTTLGIVAIVSNAIFFLISHHNIRSIRAHRILAGFMLAVDLILVSYLTYTKGGVASRTPILYALPIIMSAAILGRRAIYSATLAAIAVYNGIIWGGYLNLFPPYSPATLAVRHDFPYVLSSMIFFSTVFVVLGLTVDFITRLLREKEAEARGNLDSLNRAQSIAKIGSWSWDMRTNALHWSKTMYEIFDLTDTGKVIKSEDFLGIVHPDDLRTVRNTFRKALRKSASFSFDYRVITTAGNTKYMHTDGGISSDQHGHPVMFGTSRDVTEDRLLEQAKNEFVALASHQLRTPTTVVKQYLSMLLDGYAGPVTPAQEKYLTIANENNERQITTINDLLNVAQIDSGKMKLHPETFDLVALLRTITLEQSARVADKNQTVELRTRHSSLLCRADKHRLRMAIENIIDNAHKYSPDGKRIELGLIRRNRQIRISIKDYGIGIDTANVPKIFQKFSRIDNPASLPEEGNGLGLYWVQKVIELHGGKITVESKLQRGSTFVISLPSPRNRAKRRAS